VEEEVEGMGEEDLEEHRVVEESIKSVQCEKEEQHRVVEDSLSLFTRTGCMPGSGPRTKV
jgi:hypothetical protein